MKNVLLILLCAAAGAAGIGAALHWHQASQALQLATGTALDPRRELEDFSLIDEHGRTFGRSDLRGQWSLMFFGYTNCPDFCPATLATLASMNRKLRAANAPVVPRVLFVSVDAKRDTPEQLLRYVPYFDAQFVGLTAKDQATIEGVAQKLGVAVAIHAEKDGTYSVDHSGLIFVLDPDGKMAAVLTGPFTADSVAQDVERLAAPRA
jgi:protein SCO1/2